MRTLRFLPLAFPLLLALGCQPPEHAVLLEIQSPSDVSELRVVVQSLESPRRYQEPVFRVDRSAAQIAEKPIRVALDIGRPEYVLVHIDATMPTGEHLFATRCYPVDGVIADEILLFGPLGDLDPDGDGFVEDPYTICREPGPNGTSTLCDDDLYVCPKERASDCNPHDASIHPVAPTICLDGIDQNCDGMDELCGDLDGDGWNACPENPTEPCDCDDSNPGINPGAHDICLDGIDQDCDGEDACCDADGDGVVRCANGLPDCNDNDPTIPGPEVCDGVDNDCDGLIDELDECRGPDLDGDGVAACGREEPGALCDCNDCDPSIHGGAVERCFPPGIDEDCDGLIDEGCSPNDADGDGVDASRDCDDNDPLFFPPHGDREPPGEKCGDGRRNDCLPGEDGVCTPETDPDGDGWIEIEACEGDPNNTPGADEVCDGQDNDCDGLIDEGLSGGRDTGWGVVGCVNGVEIAFQNDPTHCGSCRDTCDDRANACMDGSCICTAAGAACAETENCCGDGCFDLMNDETHCGNCNIACGKGETCVNGVCTCGGTTGSGVPGVDAQACPDTSVGSVENNVCCDGTCRDVSMDANNCGDCRTRCGNNATCMSSHCACVGNWLNCDGDFDANGCEVDSQTNLSHCGMCGRQCQGGQAEWACNAGDCQPTSCVGSYGDCNGVAGDGCETNIATSTTHCGGCGNPCAHGERCNAGTCAPICGNGIVTAGEACDDGNTSSNDGCSHDCRTIETGWTCPTAGVACAPICGDGLRRGSEACDDGNRANGDGCSSSCTLETGWTCPTPGMMCAPICGDGLRRGGEACDDGNTSGGDGCSSTCTLETGWTCATPGMMCAPICGDGLRLGTEACDDGNMTNGDGCSSTCTLEMGWTCATPGVMCAPICGDGLRLGTEACDDGNMTNGDGCSSTCTVESGWECNNASPNVCNRICGNGTRDPGEACDDGNRDGGDGCSSTCTVESGWECNNASPNVCNRICGNGTRDPGEACDDGNTTDGDGCSSTCTVESGWECNNASPNVCDRLCGNGTVDTGEVCDDGNTEACGTCSADCQTINSTVTGCMSGTGCVSNDDCLSTCNSAGTCR